MESPNLYHTANKLQLQENLTLLNEFHEEISKGQSFLDIGSGDGYFIAEVFKNFLKPDVTINCMDISKSMCDFANQKYGHSGIKFWNLNIEDSMPDHWKEKYDVVTAFYVLNWVKSRREALHNVFDCMKSNGIFVFIYPIHCAVFDAYKTMSEGPKWKDLMSNHGSLYIPVDHDSKNPAEDLKTMLKSVGFEDICVEVEEKEFLFSSLKECEAFFLAVNPFVSKMSIMDAFTFFQEERELLFSNTTMQIIQKDDDPLNTQISKRYKTIVGFCRKP